MSFLQRIGDTQMRFAILGLNLFVLTPTVFVSGVERPELTRLFPPGGQVGTEVEVEATGKFPVWPIQAWSDSDSIHWSFDESKGKLKAKIEADTKPGLYWLRLYHADGATSVRPFLVGSIPEQKEAEPNNSVSESNAIASLPLFVQGVLAKRGDVDLFSTALSAGQKLVATVDASHWLRSPLDASLQVLDSEGFVVAENLDHFGLDPRLEYIAPDDGPVFIRVFGFPAAPDSTIAFGGGADWMYRLRLQSGDDFEFDGPKSDPIPLECELQTLEPGQAITREAAIVIELPACVRGVIAEPGQSNYFRFRATAGQEYRVRLLARELGSALDATLAILDNTGKQLAQQDDNGNDRDPDIKWKAPVEGEYFIEVKDFHQAGGADFQFELSIGASVPDFNLSIPNDLIQTTIGKETEIPVKLERMSNFTGEIVVSLEGISEGIDCSMVKSIQGSDTEKKVTLRLKSTVPFQGPIKIIASAADNPEQVRYAKAGDDKPTWLSSTAE